MGLGLGLGLELGLGLGLGLPRLSRVASQNTGSVSLLSSSLPVPLLKTLWRWRSVALSFSACMRVRSSDHSVAMTHL